MERIDFNHIIPHVFAHQDVSQSAIWDKKVGFERGHTYLIDAESGKGKSTFCSYIYGYRHDFSGSITFDDKDTDAITRREWVAVRQRHISCLFQELRLFPELTALENVIIKNNLTKYKSLKQIEEWFDALGIGDKKSSKVAHMSFGQQQRVAMIRALVQPFDFLLADEPISHLDDRNSEIMADILMEEAKRRQAAIIVTSIGKHLPITYDKTYYL